MNRTYYEEYFELERNHWWFRVREKILISELKKVINDKNGIKLLNIGAATGRSSEALADFGDVKSIEYDKDCCDYINQTLNLNLTHGSITNLPFDDNIFDVVCAFDVIEHVKDDKLAVKEMHRVCKTNGLLFISVPAFKFLWSEHDVINQHYRRYTKKDLVQLFNKFKSNKLRLTYFNSLLFFPILLFRSISRFLPKTWIRKNSGSDFSLKGENKFLSLVFYKIFSFEAKLIKYINFPLGVSLFGIWKK